MMEIHKSCCCFGHREIEMTDRLTKKLRIIFENLIVNENVRIFYFGGFGEFDDLCWSVVTEFKVKYPDIYRIYCLSDRKYEKPFNRASWFKDDNYEKVVYLDLDFDYWYSRIYFRNCKIINLSDFCVFYVKNSEKSGAYKAMQYAIKKKKDLINVAELLI